MADEVGLRVPPTVVTNDFDTAVDFMSGGATVGKAFHTGFLDEADGEAGRVVFTTRLDRGNRPTRKSLTSLR